MMSAVRAGRFALGLTQGEFANRSGVSEVSIARFEAGITGPRLSTLAKMLDALERYGVKITEDEGFTITVSEKAIMTFGERFL